MWVAKESRYLWSEKEVFKGNRGVIFGLLEELHKYFDGVSDVPEFSKKVAPYLGKYLYQFPLHRDEFDCSMNYAYPFQGGQTLPARTLTEQIAITDDSKIPNNTLDLPLDTHVLAPERIPFIKEQTWGSTFGSGTIEEDRMNISLKQFPSGVNIKTAKQESTRFPLPPRQSSKKRPFSFERIADITPKPFPSSAKSNKEVKFSQSTIKFNRTSDLGIEEPSNTFHSKKDKEVLTEWLEIIGTKLPPHFTLDAPVLEEFKDGYGALFNC